MYLFFLIILSVSVVQQKLRCRQEIVLQCHGNISHSNRIKIIQPTEVINLEFLIGLFLFYNITGISPIVKHNSILHRGSTSNF